MRVLIVVPKAVVLKVMAFPLGLAYISAQLKKDGHQVLCLNLNHYSDDMDSLIRQAMSLYAPDIVATGGMYIYLEFARAAFVMARRINPHVIRLVGGSGITAEPELFMNYTGADIGVIGEGEITVSELLKTLPTSGVHDLHKISGLIYRNISGQLIRSPERTFCKNLDEYPWPDLEGFDYRLIIDEYQNIADFSLFSASVLDRPRMIPLLTARACPFKCTFCFHSSGRKYTERSLDDVFGEIDYHLKKFKANFIMILDEVFCPDENRMIEFCNRIKPYKVKWWCLSHIKMFTPNRFSMMRDAGCVGIGYGIESMSNTVLKSMKKQNNPETVTKTLQQSYESKLDITGNFIFGDHAETLETAEETLKYWENNLYLGISLTMLALYPRSEMYVMAVDNNIIKDPPGFIKAGCPIVNASNMNNEDFSALRVRVELCGLIRRYCKVTNYSLEPTRCKTNGKLYRLTATCPHCGASSEYRNVAIPINSNTTFFLACRECFRRFVPALLKRSTLANKLDSKAQSAHQLLRTGNIDKAENICLQNLRNIPFHDLSLYVISKILQQRGELDRAFSLAHHAAIYNPAKPEYFEQLADTVPKGFIGRSSRVMREHAQWLRKQDINGVTFVTL